MSVDLTDFEEYSEGYYLPVGTSFTWSGRITAYTVEKVLIVDDDIIYECSRRAIPDGGALTPASKLVTRDQIVAWMQLTNAIMASGGYDGLMEAIAEETGDEEEDTDLV